MCNICFFFNHPEETQNALRTTYIIQDHTPYKSILFLYIGRNKKHTCK